MAKKLHVVSEEWMVSSLGRVISNDEVVINYPVPMGMHYIPESLDSLELMKTAISWKNPSLYRSLMYFEAQLQTYWKHAEDEDDYFDAEHFSHYVNVRNASRFPSPDNIDLLKETKHTPGTVTGYYYDEEYPFLEEEALRRVKRYLQKLNIKASI